jgi:NAD(P)H-dependent flavin oxidoreductase YrpB (nitropropane dioxygenase family)
VAAGGIADGEALAAALSLGAEAVWVGTRFICAKESGASQRYRDTVMTSLPNDTMRTLVITGRPVRLFVTPYVKKWETERKEESEFVILPDFRSSFFA